jgi:16S rRNA (cytosine967-C5)-methyltransferase
MLYDAILLDAPCSATGTIRSNPDILLLKTQKDVDSLQKVQQDMLVNAATLLKTGGRLVFCTCSLQPEEGEMQIEFVKENIPSLEFKEFSKEMPYYRY